MVSSAWSPDRPTAAVRPVVAAILLLFCILLIRTAWINDDAYITFRTVDNFLHGYGLRWNVANRVETYTHPLWMLAVAAVAGVTGEFYYTVLALSMLLTLAALLVLAKKLARSAPLAILGACALGLSSAFVDFATSGLEHPLTYLLLTLFYVQFFSRTDGSGRLTRLTLLAALVMTNRIDDGLLVIPPLAVAVWRHGVHRSVPSLVVGALPFLAWEAFSLVYYGFPVPNTAFAKLHTGVPRGEAMLQGGIYLLDVAGKDPVTALVILWAAVLPLWRPASRPLSAGVVLYLLYVVWIGGDFMGGRFLADAMLCATIELVQQDLFTWGAPWGLGMALVWIAGLAASQPTVTSSAAFGSERAPVEWLEPNGVNDERAFYYPFTGLLTASRGVPRPHHRWLELGLATRRTGRRVRLTDAAGFMGFGAGPGVYVLDRWALGDPLLARLPAERPWRVGHYRREIPGGYVETLETGRNAIEDPGVAEYYERLRLITEAPLWSAQRWKAIVRMNLGLDEYLLDRYRMRLARADARPVQ